MENFERFFPRYGKFFGEFSTVWKTLSAWAKTGWKSPFSRGIRLFSGGCGAEHAAPLVSRRARPAEGPGKRCPPQAGSALSRSRLGCGVVARPFSGREVGGSTRSQAKRGRCGRSEDPLRGLLKNVRGLRDHTAECRQARPQFRRAPRGRNGAGRGPESAPGRLGRRKASGPEFSA